MKKILFPTDFSKTAERAYVFALQLADKMKAELDTLHVYDLPDIKELHLPNSLKKIYDSIDLEEFESFKDSIPALRQIAEANGMGHVNCRHLLEEGETVATILDTARKGNYDLVVMGTKGSTGLKEIFLGSVTGSVVEAAPCLVLGVPEEGKTPPIKKIGFTTEFREEEKRALNLVIDFAELFDAEVHCIHVITDKRHAPKTKIQDWKDDLKTKGKEKVTFDTVNSLDVEHGLTLFIEKNEIDLLVMLTHRRNFLQRVFDHSLTKQMIFHQNTPILAIPESLVN